MTRGVLRACLAAFVAAGSAIWLNVGLRAAPANDDARGAIVLSLGAPAAGTTVAAADDYRLSPSCSLVATSTATTGPGPDVVFVFTPPTAGSYEITAASDDPVDLVLYSAAQPPVGGGAAQLVTCTGAVNRVPDDGGVESLPLALPAGVPVYVIVDTVDSTTAAFTLNVTRTQVMTPGDSPATAGEPVCGGTAAIETVDNVDFYRLGTFPMGFRVFAIVDGGATTSHDFDLRVTTATDTLEYDNDSNDFRFGDLSGNVAGTPTDGGQTYLRVSYGAPQAGGPYRLYYTVQPPPPSTTVEHEPNDVRGANLDMARYYSGQLTGPSPTTDVDYYRIRANKGDAVFVSIDLDPTRDGSRLEAGLEVFDANGSRLAHADDANWHSSFLSGVGRLDSTSPYSPSDALVFHAPDTGYYDVQVRATPAMHTSGDYVLSISTNCSMGAIPAFPDRPTTTKTFTSSTPAAIPDNGSVTVTQDVSGLGEYIVDVNLRTIVPHQFPPDLAFALTAPSGRQIILLNGQGGGTPDAFNGTVWDDQASLSPVHPPRLSTYHDYLALSIASPLAPDRALSRFNGENPNGTWSLEVLDQALTDVGTLTGWTLEITTLPAAPTVVHTQRGGNGGPVPALGTLSATAAGPAPGSTILSAWVQTTLPYTDVGDLDIRLRSDDGAEVTLSRGNGAGFIDVFNGTTWEDDAIDGVYSQLFTSGIPASSLSPHEPLGAFIGYDLSGQWTLLVSDLAHNGSGSLTSWMLHTNTLSPCAFTLTTLPPIAALGGGGTVNVTANDPTCRWTVTPSDPWLSITGGTGLGNGSFSVSITAAPGGTPRSTSVRVNATAASTAVAQLGAVYTLSEGATGPFFDYELLLANPNTNPAPVTIAFLRSDGVTVPHSTTLAPQTRTTLMVDSLAGLESTAVSAVVTSTSSQPIIVERTMVWNDELYGGHTGNAVTAASRTWYFAEGSQGFFDTYLLLANSSNSAANVDVTFLLESGEPVVRTYVVPATSRFNVFAGALAQLVNQSFSISVSSDREIFAERAMYFGTRLFEGGHESPGVPAPSTIWFLPEGATGPYFDCYILVGNVSAQPAEVQATYLLPSGATVSRNYMIPGNRRLTINVETVDPALADTAVSTTLSSSQPIVAERAMYWPGNGGQWLEAHNSFGVTAAGTRWGLAEGRQGGDGNTQTYILLANPNATAAASVRVTFLRTSGSPVVKNFNVPATSRFNVDVGVHAPELSGESFGAVVEATNGVAIAVERAMYWDAEGVHWAGGSNATAVRLP